MTQIYNDMVEVENCISSDGLIPQRFLLWLTTSRNKEGINIKSKDINDVFMESHNISDIIQMAGRVRHGAENLYIIVDSCGYPDGGYKYENVFARDYLAPDVRNINDGTDLSQWVNAHLQDLCKARKISDFYAPEF